MFIDLPNPQISFIYQSIGCQHSFQPSDNDFLPPSIPALTARGFVHWQAIETLLDPNSHVPFLQHAVHDFPILHPETGERFPVDLPASALPQQPDIAIEKWHDRCAEKLRNDCAVDERPRPTRASTAAGPDIRNAYTHVKPPHSYSATSSPHERAKNTDFFDPKSVPTRRQKPTDGIPRPKSGAPLPQRSNVSPESFEDARGRRRSVPNNYYNKPRDLPTPGRPSSQPPDPPGGELRSPSEDFGRRHSHPRHQRERSTSSSSSSSSAESAISDTPTSPLYTSRSSSKFADQAWQEKAQNGGKAGKVPVNIRYSVPLNPHPGAPLPNERLEHAHRNRGLSVPNLRTGKPQITTYKIAVDPKEKLSAPFTSHQQPHRSSGSRSNSRSNKGNVKWQDLVDIPFRRHSDGKDTPPREEPVSRSPEKGEKEKYRRDDFAGPKIEKRSASHEERVRLRERERRERERVREDSENDWRRERRYAAKVNERR